LPLVPLFPLFPLFPLSFLSFLSFLSVCPQLTLLHLQVRRGRPTPPRRHQQRLPHQVRLLPLPAPVRHHAYYVKGLYRTH
jgi:hypothetical protein